jgi:hypothetical protein
MARNYKRDAKGRFASSGSSRSKGGKGSGRSSKKDGDAIRADIISRFDKLLATPPAGGPPVRRAAANPANRVASSPRRLNKQEQIVASVMSNSKFRSDRQRRQEMIRQGISAKSDFTGLAANVRSKLGGKSTDTVRSAAKRRSRRKAS